MSEKVKFLTITEDNAGQRLDNFLISRLKGAPKSLIYKVIRKGEVRVNKGRAKPERKLQPGDTVRVPPVRLPKKGEPVPAGQSLLDLLQQSILYESRELLVINKPAGLAVHGGSGVSLGLIEALRQLMPSEPGLELVHRLDRETSGCIMVARKRSMLRYLQELLRGEKKMQKHYVALVHGRWPNRARQVDAPLLKSEVPGGERVVRVRPEGKASRTEFEVIQRYSEATLVEARPITGRTHQIRVHALHKGHPLVGDEKYGDDQDNVRMKALGFRRLFLHAAFLGVPLPGGGILEVSAPLPEDLAEPLQQLTEVDR